MTAALIIGPVSFPAATPLLMHSALFLPLPWLFSPDRWARRCSDISATHIHIAYCRQRRITVRFRPKAYAGKRFTPDNHRLPVTGAIADGRHLRADGSFTARAVPPDLR